MSLWFIGVIGNNTFGRSWGYWIPHSAMGVQEPFPMKYLEKYLLKRFLSMFSSKPILLGIKIRSAAGIQVRSLAHTHPCPWLILCAGNINKLYFSPISTYNVKYTWVNQSLIFYSIIKPYFVLDIMLSIEFQKSF